MLCTFVFSFGFLGAALGFFKVAAVVWPAALSKTSVNMVEASTVGFFDLLLPVCFVLTTAFSEIAGAAGSGALLPYKIWLNTAGMGGNPPLPLPRNIGCLISVVCFFLVPLEVVVEQVPLSMVNHQDFESSPLHTRILLLLQPSTQVARCTCLKSNLAELVLHDSGCAKPSPSDLGYFSKITIFKNTRIMKSRRSMQSSAQCFLLV